MGPRSKPEIAEGAEDKVAPSVSENELTRKIIGAAIEVHRHLGPGLLESAYEECLCYELSQLNLRFKRQVDLPIRYKGLELKCGYKMDLVVEDSVVVELKAIEELDPIHSAQLLTYLKSSGMKVGLLINFNVSVLKKGLKRIVYRFESPEERTPSSAPSALMPAEQPDAELLSASPRLSQRLSASALSGKPQPCSNAS